MNSSASAAKHLQGAILNLDTRPANAFDVHSGHTSLPNYSK
jgi:hypothetical protein